MLLAISNIIFSLMPLTRWYKLRALLLKLSGIRCNLSLRLVSSARIVIKNVIIGEDTFIGHQVLITGNSCNKIEIGSYVDIAPRVCIISGSHEIDMFGKHSAGLGSGGDVSIEDGVWIGANSIVLPGVKIGKKSIIGSGSVVVKSIPPYCVAVGNPCKPIKRWNFDTLSFERV